MAGAGLTERFCRQGCGPGGGEFAVLRAAVRTGPSYTQDRPHGDVAFPAGPHSRSLVRPAAYQFNCTFTARNPETGGANRSESEGLASTLWTARRHIAPARWRARPPSTRTSTSRPGWR